MLPPPTLVSRLIALLYLTQGLFGFIRRGTGRLPIRFC
jgi:hypothetical protein